MTHPDALSRAAFEATLSPPMRDVTTTAEALVDVWAYADPVLKALYPERPADVWDVERVYESGDQAHQHLLMPTDSSNVYVVFVVSITDRSVMDTTNTT